MPEETGKTRQVGVLLDAARVRSEMDLRGWTQAALAEHAGISQMTVSNMLAGKRTSNRLARQIAQAFIDNPPVLEGWLDRRSA